ncbi:MAG TPA: RNA-directed DNA polymerase [Actinomycetota bacterium]
MQTIEPARLTVLRSGEPIPTVRVHRPGGGTRDIAVLDPEGDRAYSAVVARVTPAVEAGLGLEVLADRAQVQGGQVRLNDWRRARRVLRRSVRAGLTARTKPAVFVGDVQACFPSVRVEVVAHALQRLGGRPSDVDRVLAVLHGFHARGLEGLPVGPAPSALLANAVLSSVDLAIRAEGVQHLRWVDDVVAICDDVASATRVADAFHRALAHVGLQANHSKTMIVTDREQAAHRLLGFDGYSPTSRSRAMLRAP